MVKTRVIRLRVIEGPNVSDQITSRAFHSLLMEVQTNAGYIHATHAWEDDNNLKIRTAGSSYHPQLACVADVNLTPVSNVCEASPRSLFFWAPNGLNELPEMHFEFPFDLIGKLTVVFLNRPIMARTQILVYRWGPETGISVLLSSVPQAWSKIVFCLFVCCLFYVSCPFLFFDVTFFDYIDESPH